nr:PHD finger protein ALFIN-LIKE 5 [Tanacetum cinerariifolium]
MQGNDEEDELEEEDEDGHGDALCRTCGENYASDEFWIYCDICERWFHGKASCVFCMKAQEQDDSRFEGWCKDESKDEDLIARISCNTRGFLQIESRSDLTLSIAYALSDPAKRLHVFLQLEMEEGNEIDAIGGGDEDKKPNTGDQGDHINLKVKARSDLTLSIAYALCDPAERLHVFLQLEMEEGNEIDAMLYQTGGGDEDKKPNTGDQGAHINLKVKARNSSIFLISKVLKRGSESKLKYEKMQGNDEEDELEEEDEDGNGDTLCRTCG